MLDVCIHHPLHVTGQNGHGDGSIPTHAAEYIGSDIVPKVNLDSRQCWSDTVTHYYPIVLLLCK